VLVTHGVTSRLLRCIVLGRASADLSSVPGGQGVVHHLRDGSAAILTA
jgi:probable phosphoglycerate mutase